jgi:hypothetical protein
VNKSSNPSKVEISKPLRFWVECEYANRRETGPEVERLELLAEILCEFEGAGDAMRFLNRSGEIVWRATPRMLQGLADAERETKAEMEEWS